MEDQVDHDIHTNYGPIRLLQPELLRLIFLENTQPADDDRLLTARSSSQVCQQWREILLSSSVLWGRLIVVDQLHFTKVEDPWRNEVLARSGSALLWIQGHFSVTNQENFLSFLERHWERVERVDITGDREVQYHPRSVIELWNGLESTAPNLKAFSLNHVGNIPPFSPSIIHITHSLFKNGAPKLREISVPDMKFDTCSPWLSNIRSITLSTVFSIQDMFTILESTPLLTNLDITMRPVGGFSQPVERYQRSITLPFLEIFCLNAYFHVAVPFFELLDFPAACIPAIILDTHGWGDPSVMDKERESVPIMRDRIIKRIKKHLPLRRMTHMSINIERWGMEFFFSGHDGIHTSTSLNLNAQINSPSHIVEELSICDYLPPVKEMTLTVDILHSSSSDYLAQFPSCSVSLTTLITNEATLKFFLDLKSQRQDCAPFPALEVLKLTYLGPAFVKDRYPSQIIWDFFQWQGTGPSPISIFDLSTIPFHDLYDMEYLDQVPGLKIVKWFFPSVGPAQYECGSGDPEALRFKYIWISHLRRMAQSRSTLRFPM